MGKGLVRFLNLGYLAACAVSIWAICTKPVFSTSIKLDMTPQKLGETLEPLFVDAAESKPVEEKSLVRGTRADKKITDLITVDRIAEAFTNKEDPKKNGVHIELPITVEAKYAFNLNDKEVLNKLVVANIETILDNTCDFLAEPLANFVFSITKEFAVDALETSINTQIKNATGEDSPITTEEVEELYDNIYEALSNNEGSIPLSDLTDVIINGKDGEGTSALSILNKFTRYMYEKCEPQPTEEQYNANPDIFFIHDDVADKYVHPESYSSELTFYTYSYVECDPQPTKEEFEAESDKFFIYDSENDEFINPTKYDNTATYYRRDNPYTQEDLDRINIEEKMEDALSTVPGLVDNEYTAVDPSEMTKERFESTLRSTKYYISKDGKYLPASLGENTKPLFVEKDGEYVAAPSNPSDFDSTLASNTFYVLVGEEYVVATTYSASTQYYVCIATVKDVDSALVALINEYLLNKDVTKQAPLRSSRVQVLNAKSRDELKAALKEFAFKYIPMNQITSVSNSYGKYVPIVLLGLMILVGFPWALLALVTLIRTLRRDKVWTKPWIVLVLAFPQLIFGIFLTYGLKYGLPLAGKMFDIIQKMLDVGLSAEISTLCLIPSFVYLAVFVYSIIYAFAAHGAKVEYKFQRMLRRSRYYY